MRLGMIGLGRMGMNMVRRLLKGDHEVVAFNRTPDKIEQIGSEGAESAFSLEELVGKLETPRIVWIMLPAGKIVRLSILGLIKAESGFAPLLKTPDSP